MRKGSTSCACRCRPYHVHGRESLAAYAPIEDKVAVSAVVVAGERIAAIRSGDQTIAVKTER